MRIFIISFSLLLIGCAKTPSVTVSTWDEFVEKYPYLEQNRIDKVNYTLKREYKLAINSLFIILHDPKVESKDKAIVNIDIAYEYTLLGQYKMAEEYTEDAIACNPDHVNVPKWKEDIEKIRADRKKLEDYEKLNRNNLRRLW